MDGYCEKDTRKRIAMGKKIYMDKKTVHRPIELRILRNKI